jgi:hypothetical protein
MQCGPIRHTAARPVGAPHDLEVVPRSRFAEIDLPPDAGIQDVFRHIATDDERTRDIAAEVKNAFAQGRKVLVLTERTEHLDAISSALNGQTPPPLVLHGRMSRKQRSVVTAELDALPADAPRILLATICRAAPSGTLGQDRRPYHRFCRHRSPDPAANVGEAAARVSRHGISGEIWRFSRNVRPDDPHPNR